MAVKEVYAYLCVKDAPAAIDFYTRAFGVREKFRLVEPSGRIGHAELDFDGTTVMLSDEFPDHGVRGPRPGDPTSVTIHLHVDDTDAMVRRAAAAAPIFCRGDESLASGPTSPVFDDPLSRLALRSAQREGGQ